MQTAKSRRAAYLYIVAAILMFVQYGVISFALGLLEDFPYVQQALSGVQWIVLVFGAVFFVGAIFAWTGFGVTATVDRPIGGGYAQRGVETANGITCGLMAGIGAILLALINSFLYMESSGGLVIFGLIPTILGGIFAMLAGIDVVRKTYSGTKASPGYDSEKVPFDSVDCPYCGKKGISPQAKTCPSCGQPLT